MAITAADVKKLRDMTGAGMMDCKQALNESNGDFDAAIEYLRKKGQKVASKRVDREANEGVALAATSADKKYAAVVVLSCETDFVAKNEDFVAVAKSFLDLAIEKRPADLAALLQLELNGLKVADVVTEQVGKIGEKIELTFFASVSGEDTTAYIHQGNKIATVVAFNKSVDAQLGKDVAMQIAAMNPVSVDENDCPQEVINKEIEIGKEKTVQDLVQKATEVALKKEGINPAHVDSEDHINSNTAKGWLTEEQATKAREIIAKVAAEEPNNIPAAKIEQIAKGRLKKFFTENTLLNQESIKESKISMKDCLAKADKDLKVLGFKRFGIGGR